MGISIGVPALIPDGTTLSQSGGAVGLKPGTEGDLLLAGATGAFAVLNIGANGLVLTSDGTTAAWSASTSAMWTYLEKITYANESGDKTSGNLTNYDDYLIVAHLTSANTTSETIGMQINSVTGNVYSTTFLDAPTATLTANAAYWTLGGCFDRHHLRGMWVLERVGSSESDGFVEFYGYGIGNLKFVGCGTCGAGSSTAVETITIKGGTSMTGTVEIWGKNRQ